jgi:hypothetical protein
MVLHVTDIVSGSKLITVFLKLRYANYNLSDVLCKLKTYFLVLRKGRKLMFSENKVEVPRCLNRRNGIMNDRRILQAMEFPSL